MAWGTGQPWRVVRSLERLREQIRAAYPQAVPPATPAASWGSIADSAHSSTSDHYPHYYAVIGQVAVVCARDFPHAPTLGLDAHALADELRRSHDPRIGYVISNGRITGPARGWRWDPYTGTDPHDTHIHVSTVHTAAADDARDWQILEDDMPTIDEIRAAVREELKAVPQALLGAKAASWMPDSASTGGSIYEINGRSKAIYALVAELAGKDVTDEPAIIAGVLAGLTPEAIAAAIPTDMARQVADELASRLAG